MAKFLDRITGGSLQRENDALRSENQALRDELEAIKFSPNYGVAQDLENVALQYVSNEIGPEELEALQEQIYERRKLRVMAEYLSTTIGCKVDELIQENRPAIETQAEGIVKEAREVAKDNVSLTVGLFRKTLAERLTGEELATTGRVAAFALMAEMGIIKPTELPDASGKKDRVAKLHEKVQHAHYLDFNWLKKGDEITLGFARSGGGYGSIETWGNTGMNKLNYIYNQEDELRRLSFRVETPESGTAVITYDSWLDGKVHATPALRAGQKVQVMNTVPLEDDDTEGAAIIRGEELELEWDGLALNTGDSNVVWWIKFGDKVILPELKKISTIP